MAGPETRKVARSITTSAMRHPLTGTYVTCPPGHELELDDPLVGAFTWAFEIVPASTAKGEPMTSAPIETTRRNPGERRQ